MPLKEKKKVILIELGVYCDRRCDVSKQDKIIELIIQMYANKVTTSDLEAASGTLIRCKDCRYWKSDEERAKQSKWLPCMEIMTDKKWYCGSAEPKKS